MQKERIKSKGFLFLFLSFAFCVLSFDFAYAPPSTHIWAPSTDIQPWGKIHVTADTYTPTTSKGTNADNYDQHNYVQQVYGLTFSLLSDKPEGNGLASDSQSHKPEENLLGKIWKPLGKVMAETGFDYKKGFGSFYDSTPWYFNFKSGVPEGAYFKDMPAFAVGIYEMGTRSHRTNYNLGYFKAAKTISLGKVNLGRFSAGYFSGNGRLLRDKNGLRDNNGPLFCWERTMSEISDRLWLAVDYQGTQSSYGALNLGFAWQFTNNASTVIGYDIYSNRNFTDTITFQLDIDF